MPNRLYLKSVTESRNSPITAIALIPTNVLADVPVPTTANFVNPCESSGAEGARTPDLLGAIQALSQLSYSPARERNLESAPPTSNP